MAKFRKKPVVIEAFQWTGGIDQEKDPKWHSAKINIGDIYFDAPGTPQCVMRIITLEGVMAAQCGDWIIQGVNGEIYPCKPDIFQKTYEPFEPVQCPDIG